VTWSGGNAQATFSEGNVPRRGSPMTAGDPLSGRTSVSWSEVDQSVLVTGTVSTTCPAGAARPVEHATATLVVVTTSTGWRVDQRLF
jgi:hypothetical protein